MDFPYWQKQLADKPLFADILWEKPERRDLAGRMLIVGGNAHGFHNVAASYAAAAEAGIGEAKVLLPEPLRHTTKHLTDIVYGPAGQTGGFSQKSRDTLYSLAAWAGGTLLAGDNSKNSETTILLQNFIKSLNAPLAVTKDAVELLNVPKDIWSHKSNLIIVPSGGGLQKILTACQFPKAYIHSLQLTQVVELLHDITTTYQFGLIILHSGYFCAAKDGQVITTPTTTTELWQSSVSAKALTYILQHPRNTLAAMATALCREAAAD